MKNLQQNHQKYNSKFFKRYAPIYDYMGFILKGLRTKTAALIPSSNKTIPLKILDMACGTGEQSLAFAKKGHNVTGIDLSPDMLKIANQKKHPNLKMQFLLSDATRIPFKTNTFDASCVSLALHDMPHQIAISVLKEMKRTTKPNGKIIIVDYSTPQNPIGNLIVSLWESIYFKKYHELSLDHFIKKAGLKKQKKFTWMLNNFQIVECSK